MVTGADSVGALTPLLVSHPPSPMPSRCRPGSLCLPHLTSKGPEHLLSWAWAPRGTRLSPALEGSQLSREPGVCIADYIQAVRDVPRWWGSVQTGRGTPRSFRGGV